MAIPYVRRGYTPSSRMADLVLLRGQQAADAERESGARSAALWSNLGQQVGRTMADVVQAREMEPVTRARALQVENAELENAARKATAKADTTQRALMPLALSKGEDGVFRYDRDLLTKEFTTAGIADRLPELFAGLDKADQASLAFKQARQNALAGLGYGVVVSGGSPQSFALAMDHAVKNGVLSQQEALPYLKAVEDNPARVMEIARSIAASDPEYAEKVKTPEKKPREIKVRNADGTETILIVEDAPGQTFTSAAEAPKVGSFEEYTRSLPRPWATYSSAEKAAHQRRFNELTTPPPRTASLPDQDWVMRDGVLTPIQKGTARAGDVPYTDAGASKAQEKSEASNKALAAMRAYGDDMLDVLDTLIDAEGNLLPGVAGVIGSFDGARPEWAYATGESQNALADIDRLQSMLNINVLRDMKNQSATGATGFGALSERELNVVESSASKLRRRRQTDSEYAAELQRLRNAILAGRKDEPSLSGGTVRMRAPNGQETDVPASEVEFFKSRGATVVKG